jgi:thiamine-phosphate pyrophosphorylase
MIQAGVLWVQVRAKAVPGAELERELDIIFSEQAQAGSAALWMDDRADLAAVYPFCGVHVGQKDLAPEAARKSVGREKWIGLSTHDLRQVQEGDRDPDVDVLALGPVFSTDGKVDPDPVVGPEAVARARAATAKPLVAIGGITHETAAAVLEAGADTVAVLGAVCRGDVATNCRRLLEAVR